jgi:hypothetical protein
MKFESAELILGHKLRYFKLEESHLASQFVKFIGGLYITRVPELEQKVAQLEDAATDVENRYYLLWKRAEDRIDELEKLVRDDREAMREALRELKARALETFIESGAWHLSMSSVYYQI